MKPGHVVVLMGPEGVGKQLQGKLLAEQGYHTIRTPDLLREAVKEPDAEQQLLNWRAGDYHRDKPAPEAEVRRLLAQAVQTVPADDPLVIIGHPRQPQQATWLGQLLREQERLALGIVIDADDETIRRRRNGHAQPPDQHRQSLACERDHCRGLVMELTRHNVTIHVVSGNDTPERVTHQILRCVATIRKLIEIARLRPKQ